MRIVHEHEREATGEAGQHLLQRDLRDRAVGTWLRSNSTATSSATSAESVVESSSARGSCINPGSIPSCWASSTVLVRLPLWPSAKPASPTDR
jgi:hypothetical protein